MKYAILIARVLLGIVFVVFGSNAFLHFIPTPPLQGQAGAFIGALIASGYIYAVAILQIVGGLLLLIGRFVPLGLALLGPVIVNIMLYHIRAVSRLPSSSPSSRSSSSGCIAIASRLC